MIEPENFILKNVSYLHARDPSILAWNRHGLDEVRVNLAEELLTDNTVKSTETPELEESGIQVFLRIKNGVPFENLYEVKDNNLICKVPDGSHALRNIKEGETMTKTYSFSKIFGPETKQIQIFNDIVKAKMLGFINGRNCTLLTYGASGAGKTFTIVGTSEEPGLIPRALEYIFRTVPHLKEAPRVAPSPNGEVKFLDEKLRQTEHLQKSTILNATLIDRSTHIKTYKQMQQRLSSEPVAEIDDLTDVSVSIWVSFAEIYNEHIYDLLKPPPPRGRQRPKLRLGNSKGYCYIKDLTSIHVSSGIEAYQILQYGLHHLNYAATSINSHSSRSHCIFTVKMIQASEVGNEVYISTFNFCDLAGSERVKKTMNVGDRLKESNNINTSLLVLGRCISNIRSAQQLGDNRMIPFRESKLTQLFQRALTGLEDIMMIVNINPSGNMFDESQHVLNFSAIAKEIIVEEQPKIVKPKKINRFSQYMESKGGNIRAIQEVKEETEDEKDLEINRLKIIITDMYTEIENKRREFDIELSLERNHIITTYKEIINDLEEQKERAIERVKKQHAEEIQSLTNYYSQRLNDCDDQDIICLDSSSDDTEDSFTEKRSTKKEIKNLENIVNEQRNEIKALQQELREIKIEKQRDTQVMQKLKEQIKNVKEEEITLRITLNEAEEAYSELQSELQELKNKNKKLVSENLQLLDKVENLEEQLLSYTSTQCHTTTKEEEHLEEQLVSYTSTESHIAIKEEEEEEEEEELPPEALEEKSEDKPIIPEIRIEEEEFPC